MVRLSVEAFAALAALATAFSVRLVSVSRVTLPSPRGSARHARATSATVSRWQRGFNSVLEIQ